MPAASFKPVRSPLVLLLAVNARQSFRRLLSLRQHSRLLTGVIGGFMAGYLGVAFWLFWEGLSRLARFPGVGTLLVERLLYLMFGLLFVLLLLSNLVISYTNLFRHRETQALLTLPVPAQTVFQWKFIESTLLASWAFLFLIAPFLAAYGLTHGVRWHFYPLTVLLMGWFIILPGVAGAWLALLVARYMERRTFQGLALTLAVVVIALGAAWLKPEPGVDQMGETRVLEVLDKVLAKTRLAQGPWLPSYWLASSVLQWSDGAFAAAAFFILVLLSNVLFFGCLGLTGRGRFFFEAMSAVNSRGSVLAQWAWFRVWRDRRPRGGAEPGRLERWARLLFWLPPDVRALIIKDTRMFWRDTSQWAQTATLFGVLGAYLLNLRHFALKLDQPFWIHLVSHLNLLACTLNLATLTTRFVYPQFSLEGRRLWIVGLAPLGMARLVKTKFALAFTAALVITVGLICLSSYMLSLPTSRAVYFSLIVAIMAWTLTSLAVSLGVLYPNLGEDNPSRIVSGFGGTFCLVLSFLYILGSIVLLAASSPWAEAADVLSLRLAGCLGAFGALSIGLGCVPFALALRRLRSMEM
jgi:ABC-2 type transport system permease protein